MTDNEEPEVPGPHEAAPEEDPEIYIGEEIPEPPAGGFAWPPAGDGMVG